MLLLLLLLFAGCRDLQCLPDVNEVMDCRRRGGSVCVCVKIVNEKDDLVNV